MTAPHPCPRQAKQLDAGVFQAEISSFALHLAAEGKSPRTIRTYTVTGKGRKPRTVKMDRDAARSLDRYLRARSRHAQAWRPQVWLAVGGRGPLTASGIYQVIARRGVQAGVAVHPHRFRHHFSHTWLDRGGPEGDLMELCGWTSPQMLQLYGASARSARARRTYDRVMDNR